MPPNELELEAEWDDVADDDDDITDEVRLSWWEEMASLPNASPETQELASRMREIAGASGT